MNSIIDSLEIVEDTSSHTHDINSKTLLNNQYNQSSSSESQQDVNHLKVSSSTKPSLVLSSTHTHKHKKIPNYNSYSLKNTPQQDNLQASTQNKLPSSDALRKLTQNDQFICESCSHYHNPDCNICKGRVKMNGKDKIIKFFEYILEFKVGKKQSYKQKEEKKLTKRNHPNEHCNMYFSNVSSKLPIDQKIKAKVRFSINNDKFSRDDQIFECQQFTKQKETHYGFNCDQCAIDPIKGQRYHCNTCQDFDLCQDCFLRFGHRHDVERVQAKQIKKPFEINQLFRGSIAGSIKNSIRNSSTFRTSMADNKTYKSWIR